MKHSTEARIALLGGHTAPTELYNEVYENIKAGVSSMQPNKLYTAKMLVEEGYWETLPSVEWKRLAGRCFAHMVSTKQFPLKFVQYKKICTKHYQTL